MVIIEIIQELYLHIWVNSRTWEELSTKEQIDVIAHLIIASPVVLFSLFAKDKNI